MKIVLLFAVLLAGGFLLVRQMGAQPPLRGLAHIPDASQQVLASRARPAVQFVPAPGMVLQTAGWRDLIPKTRVTEPGNARLWFASDENGEGVLITALAEATDPWLWDHGHNEPFPVLQAVQYEHAGQTLYESLMAFRAGQNPFDAAGQACLVYRAKFVLQFRKMLVIAEYHEPVPDDAARDAAFDPQRLDAFRQRGRKACTVAFPDREAQEALKERLSALKPADAVFSRTGLSRWVGEMRRPKDI